MEPLALWGAFVGTAGAGIAGRREYLSNRRRLTVVPNVRINASRQEPVGELTGAFASVQFWNTGGRPLAVERVGFRFLAEAPDGSLQKRRAEILLEAPVEAQVDGPSHTIYTPLGPMMAGGISPFGELEAFALTHRRAVMVGAATASDPVTAVAHLQRATGSRTCPTSREGRSAAGCGRADRTPP